MKIGKRRRESSKRIYYIISSRVIIKAIFTNHRHALVLRCRVAVQISNKKTGGQRQIYRSWDLEKANYLVLWPPLSTIVTLMKKYLLWPNRRGGIKELIIASVLSCTRPRCLRAQRGAAKDYPACAVPRPSENRVCPSINLFAKCKRLSRKTWAILGVVLLGRGCLVWDSKSDR